MCKIISLRTSWRVRISSKTIARSLRDPHEVQSRYSRQVNPWINKYYSHPYSHPGTGCAKRARPDLCGVPLEESGALPGKLNP
jgi:hypothetical protein